MTSRPAERALTFDVYQVSRRGGRVKNEDRMGYCYTRSSGLFALADGMGGHPEGEVAAQLSLQTLASMFQRDARPVLPDPARFLNDAVLAAHHRLLHHATDRGLLDTPRTTIVVCVVQHGQAWWAHCGDSRLYLLRGGEVLARTRDHSYLELQNAMARNGAAGVATPTPARAAMVNRNVLFTCLGSPGRPVIDAAGPVPLEPHDKLMLCSDGLWSPLPDTVIAEVLDTMPIAEAVPELAERALRRAGPKSDNVTLLAMEWDGVVASQAGDADRRPARELGQDEFASTIQGGAADAQEAPELDDDEIERSIREINDAIRRTRANKTGTAATTGAAPSSAATSPAAGGAVRGTTSPMPLDAFPDDGARPSGPSSTDR